MLKLRRVLLLILIFTLLISTNVWGAVFLHGVEIPTLFINNQNYIGNEQLRLFGVDGEVDEDLISLREAADVCIMDKPRIDRGTLTITPMGNVIEAVYFEPVNYSRTVLAVFGLHGYEDWYPKDGQLLVDTANAAIEDFMGNIELIGDTRYIIVPCANPDGLIYGYTENGFGRCNAEGIDLNRDFDYNWGKIYNPRWKTGDMPFSAAESRALRDLVLRENPDIVLDFHGWLDCVYTKNMDAELIRYKLNLGNTKPALPGFKESQGYFYAWAGKYAKSALIELKEGKDVGYYKNQVLTILTEID